MEDYAKLLKNGLDSIKFLSWCLENGSQIIQRSDTFLTGKAQQRKDYHKKLNALIKTYDLTYYDKKKQPLNQWNQI